MKTLHDFKTIDEYLRAVPRAHRTALERLRKIIRAAAPGAEECISYQLPAFRLDGFVVAFGSAEKHCSFYPGGIASRPEFARSLVGFSTSKGTIRFQPGKPLPAALIRKIVKLRISENLERRLKSKKTRTSK